MFCCIKCRDFTKLPGVETFRKRTVILPKLCGNCTIPQKFCSRKLGEISVFYPMFVLTVLKDSEQNMFGGMLLSKSIE